MVGLPVQVRTGSTGVGTCAVQRGAIIVGVGENGEAWRSRGTPTMVDRKQRHDATGPCCRHSALDVALGLYDPSPLVVDAAHQEQKANQAKAVGLLHRLRI